ncbi:hypothetical protein X777_10812 [Ooceraea biroi]|uniref:Uncharacterized protein n=1 Tax=Ooceraea biroi TaxID=2015173 RepID=A0A026W3Y1_OOCBI|nr:hypothetical protein X777_10812 [Ooceraea biroi]
MKTGVVGLLVGCQASCSGVSRCAILRRRQHDGATRRCDAGGGAAKIRDVDGDGDDEGDDDDAERRMVASGIKRVAAALTVVKRS